MGRTLEEEQRTTRRVSAHVIGAFAGLQSSFIEQMSSEEVARRLRRVGVVSPTNHGDALYGLHYRREGRGFAKGKQVSLAQRRRYELLRDKVGEAGVHFRDA